MAKSTKKKINTNKAKTKTKNGKNHASKKRTVKNKKKTGSGFIFKFIFSFLIVFGVVYSLFFFKNNGKTAYNRIMENFNTKSRVISSKNSKPVRKIKKNEDKQNVNRKISQRKVVSRAKRDIIKARRRNKSIEKVVVNKKRVDFIKKKTITDKERNNLNNIINSNL